MLKLQVGEVRPRVLFSPPTSEVVEAALFTRLLLVMRSMAVLATDPGVRLGSSSGFLRLLPFHGLPGSNSGMPKLSPMPFKACIAAADVAALLLSLFLLSGHPEEVEEEGTPQVSSTPKPTLDVLDLVEKASPALSGSFHCERREPPGVSVPLLLLLMLNALNRSGIVCSAVFEGAKEEPVPPLPPPIALPPPTGGMGPPPAREWPPEPGPPPIWPLR